MHLSAREIAKRAGGEVLAGDPEARVASFAFDSRALAAGAAFVALRGHRDGHDFVADAFRAGAHVAIVDHRPEQCEPNAGQALVRVDDTLAALQDVARSVRAERAALRVVAVAGSTGKTTTKDLLAAALTPLGAHANPESYNNEFGLPLTLLNAPASAKVVVTEMGERVPGDLAHLCAIAEPDVAVVTNVGLAHAEHLGGTEGAAATFGELLGALPSDGLAVLSADDEWTARLAAGCAARVVTVGFGTDADYRVEDVALDGTLVPSFRLGPARFDLALRGAHQVVNAAMAAVAAHVAFGLPWDEIAPLLRTARTARWRMELVESPGGVTVLNDAYNANPASMEAALRALAHLDVGGRRIAVLGDMRELGDHAEREHARIGTLAAEIGVDRVIGVGAGGVLIARAASAAGVDVIEVPDAPAALGELEGSLRAGDAVLVKASRALGLQVVADALAREGDA